MAKNVSKTCCGCQRWVAWIVLAAGVLWLLQDYGRAPWWSVSWYTLAALVLGVSWIGRK